MHKKGPVIIVGFIGVMLGVFFYLWSPASDAPQMSVEGTFVDSSEYKDFPIKGKGQKVNENLRFNVDGGKIIVVTRHAGDVSEPVTGQPAKIFYKVGRAFQNRVYLGYEWLVP